MNKLNEGQTQVYADGHVDPQYGVNTGAPYLNNPPQQLLDIATEFFKSGKSEAQVLAILVGMGTKQQLALSAIQALRGRGPMTETQQKNHTNMKFTLVDLYENVVNTIDKLETLSADKSRVSYSTKQAKDLLESALGMFPEMTINSNIIAKLTTEEIATIKSQDDPRATWLTLVDEKVTPVLKYNIAKAIHNTSAIHDWVKPISELRGYIDNMYATHTFSFKVNEAVLSIGTRNNPLDGKLAVELTTLLNETEDVIKAGFESIAAKNPWSAECKAILNEMKAEAQGADQARAVVLKTFTPILTEGTTVIFDLHGSTFGFDGTEVTEANVTDSRFGQVREGLEMFKQSGNSLVLFGEAESALKIDLTEGTIGLGKIDLSEKTSQEIKESLLASKFFSARNAWKADKVAAMIEHLDMVAEMDTALSLTSTEFLNVYLTMLAVESNGGVWMHKVNPAMSLNEMKFYPTATKALKEAKDFIGYDATSYLSKSLIAEGEASAIVEHERTVINSEISFLEEKKEVITAAIKRIGISEELTEALGLVEGALSKKEQELQATYIVEKKTKRDYLNDGYTEATMSIASGPFEKGQDVMVNAEEYSSLGDDGLIDVVDANTMKSEYIERGKLKIKI